MNLHVLVTGGAGYLGSVLCERTAGRPYNASLDAANLSKEELALKIKEYVPNFYVHFAQVDQIRISALTSFLIKDCAKLVLKPALAGRWDSGVLKRYRMTGRARFKNV